MSPTLPPIRGQDRTTLAWKVELSPLAAVLTEPERAALTAVICGPLAFAFVARCDKADRPEMIAALKQIRVPKLVAWEWLRGLVYAGHGENVLAGYDR
jgi:hypothetical protein